MNFQMLSALSLLGVLAGRGPASALPHDPKAQPCLFDDCRVPAQPGAELLAANVDKLPPGPMARVEPLQGRPFGGPVAVVAYADFDADRTHEFSHAHLLSYFSSLSVISLPSWFTEGIAVLVSGGGGAQQISPEEARRAIAAGQSINPVETAGFLENSLPGAHMAYRPAGMFVGFRRAREKKAFGVLRDGLYAGQEFKNAFRAAYGAPVAAFWDNFARDCARKGA
ncbi:hypothetical protein GJ654_16260 [Rhodoblastus acidophilus]|uniref:Uncharacterized protein n=1 Tax=Rhodoblastus acidophilus TaxID=1074 RepID=A0A6N8DPP2_RHOAC|nr:hypothetical protein [Rhodoblastus acidophilus]MCW2274594.1 hypothetical protein [Rhodoblastus acidophilus]MTV32540.1 hypothetical protein [Rhodoblastus acidophilus]